MIREKYQQLYERQAMFYRSHPKAKATLIAGNYALTALIVLAYALLCVIKLGVYPSANPRRDVLRIVFVPLLCLLVVSVLRGAVNRKRPYEAGGIFPLLDKKKKGHSFPSRHVACAFVIGMVFLPYYAWAGALVLLAGALLGYIRFAGGVHYPSDIAAGAAAGVLFGLMVFI